MATVINHDIDQGSNFSFSYVVKGTDGVPTDISSGFTAYAQMRRFYSSSSSINFTTSITGTTGNILVSLGATASASAKAGIWFYDVELHSNGSANVQRIVQGMITIYPEITKIP
jgi:hypothetical protein